MLDQFGGNQYTMTHMGKEKLEREGRLPMVLEVNPVASYFL